MDIGDGYDLTETQDTEGNAVLCVTLGNASVVFRKLNPSSTWRRSMIHQARSLLAQFSEEGDHA